MVKAFTRKSPESLLSETRCSPAEKPPSKAQVEQSMKSLFDEPVQEDPDEYLDRMLAEETYKTHRTHLVFQVGEIDPGKDKDTVERLVKLTRQLRNKTLYRPVCLPGPNLEARIEHLVAAFPNFQRVTRSIIGVHAKLLARGIDHRMPPVLLLGPPGVGKTVYAEAAGELLSAPVLRLDFASENSPSGLAGSSTFWANSSPGRLFSILANGDNENPVANPVVFVDELDKAPKNSQYDITGPLLRLLEKASAQKFVDQSVPHITVDASCIRWIITSNDLESISEPLRSRLVVFNIQPPTPEQAKQIAQNIATKTVTSFGVDGFYAKLPDKILADCATMTPREARIRIEIAIGLAITEDLDCITPAIWESSALDEEPLQERRRTIGFI